MVNSSFLFSSESVTEGHPDKIADQISDAVLDTLIAQDKKCRVACECFVTTGLTFIGGEITTIGYAHIPDVARQVIKDIGYVEAEMGFDYNTCAVITSIDRQSPDIAMGVNQLDPALQGAGDQGIMFGYACNETEELMPLPIILAHKICMRLAEARKKKVLTFLRPDGKSQISVDYRNGKPHHVSSVVVAAQHIPDVSRENVIEGIMEEVIKKVIPSHYLNGDTNYYINPTGRFVIGGPQADSGLTGRKIIVDSYGGWGRHGGGCFSGKDPSKVDRSGSYYVRYVAKNIVAAGLADRCEVQVAYAIGVAHPVSVLIETEDTEKVPLKKIQELVHRHFDFRPGLIIQELDLLRPIFRKTAVYGHFGRNDPDFSWEKTDKAAILKAEAFK